MKTDFIWFSILFSHHIIFFLKSLTGVCGFSVSEALHGGLSVHGGELPVRPVLPEGGPAPHLPEFCAAGPVRLQQADALHRLPLRRLQRLLRRLQPLHEHRLQRTPLPSQGCHI